MEEVTGQGFADYMRDHVLRPLGMRNSDFALEDVDAGYLALSYDGEGAAAPFRHYTALVAASLYSTADDMARFVAAHHSGQNGEPVGREVLRPETVIAMRVIEARRFGLPIWGLGTILYAPDGQGSFVIGHEGGNAPAVTTTARFNPATGDGIVVLQTGRPELPARIGAEWVRWQTGRSDIVVLIRRTGRFSSPAARPWGPSGPRCGTSGMPARLGSCPRATTPSCSPVWDSGVLTGEARRRRRVSGRSPAGAPRGGPLRTRRSH
ncbi:MAG: Beta-lactamase class C-like and penicillin binding proteins (PBPs) superfamily [uncultured Rubellimicrobium sp.]|uniref:Beta-lactamase class C-like and penicillin binding proteins (PBPs) superfamily n=1 Tax=uncultured Rubellimicrobium sp. TaxID=543078 RepID=A0A6J4PVN9_9RHOB|nr:MAG: Beta-lactamase class C-like and penicillin binding proteins (PBPs) superfamily [uncultured Rubellimicrobium sp.]